MTGKIQKIREEVEKLKLCTMDEHMKFYSEAAEAEYNALCKVEKTINSLQEEPLSDKTEKAIDELSTNVANGLMEQLKENLQEEPVSEANKVVQVRRCLEEVATTINPFIDEVIEQFNLKDKSIVAKEIQYRGVGLKGDFGENIHRSDDEVIYILKEDKTVGLIVIRRTEFNNAEITMVKTEERLKKKSND